MRVTLGRLAGDQLSYEMDSLLLSDSEVNEENELVTTPALFREATMKYLGSK